MSYFIYMKQNDVRQLLAQNIKKQRKELGITQAKLAELAEISEPYMNDIERCQTWISDKTLAKLAWALKMDIYELFIQPVESKPSDKKKISLIFQKQKQKTLDFIERSFETLLRDVVKN